MTPHLLPPLPLALATQLLQPQPPLNPLLAPHLTKSGQRPGKRESLLVAREDAAILQHRHVHAQVVHQGAHGVVEVLAVGRGRGDGAGFLGGGERFAHFGGGEEELGEGHLGGEDEFGLRCVSTVRMGENGVWEEVERVSRSRKVK